MRAAASRPLYIIGTHETWSHLAELVHLDGECLDRRRRPRVRAVGVVEAELVWVHSSEHIVCRPLALAPVLPRRRLELEVLLRQPQEKRELLGRAESAAGFSGGGSLVSGVSARPRGGFASKARVLQALQAKTKCPLSALTVPSRNTTCSGRTGTILSD